MASYRIIYRQLIYFFYFINFHVFYFFRVFWTYILFDYCSYSIRTFCQIFDAHRLRTNLNIYTRTKFLMKSYIIRNNISIVQFDVFFLSIIYCISTSIIYKSIIFYCCFFSKLFWKFF